MICWVVGAFSLGIAVGAGVLAVCLVLTGYDREEEDDSSSYHF